MKRHIGFPNHDSLVSFLIENGCRHSYFSGALYISPDHLNMRDKEYQGCDFVVDIDVDHFHTPCKDKHDSWICKDCNNKGKGSIEKCPKCNSSSIKKNIWVCDDCLKIAKDDISKIIYDFLLTDFNINENNILITFSGHRGYHLKVEDKKLRRLTTDHRREMVAYMGVDIDIPVTIDIHRLIRYPNSLHGKTGFKAQELSLKQLENFNPLSETDEKIDPIVFYGNKTTKLEITTHIPKISIKDEEFGAYNVGEIIEVPHHIAVLFLCKEVAKGL